MTILQFHCWLKMLLRMIKVQLHLHHQLNTPLVPLKYFLYLYIHDKYLIRYDEIDYLLKKKIRNKVSAVEKKIHGTSVSLVGIQWGEYRSVQKIRRVEYGGWRVEYGGWRVKKKLVGRKIFSVMKLEGENWSVEGGVWRVEGGMVAHAPIPTRDFTDLISARPFL